MIVGESVKISFLSVTIVLQNISLFAKKAVVLVTMELDAKYWNAISLLRCSKVM